MNKKRVMSESDYRLFRALASLSQDDLKKQLLTTLKKKYKKVISTKEYLYALGNIPIALVAHMDTVFKYLPADIYYDTRQNVMWSPDGLGADDRAGVFVILKVLQSNKNLRPTIIFTTDEEKGGLGAFELVEKYDKPLSKLNYIIQLDRRGSNDCVFYDCDNREFVDYVESFGFVENFGSFSDIGAICPEWGVAGVNLSVGYKDEHTTSETLHVDALYDTVDKVMNMLQQENIPEFKYIPTLKSYRGLYGYNYYDYDEGFNFSHKLTPGKGYKCKFCGGSFEENEILPVQFYDERDTVYVCAECCLTHVDWCPNCDTAFRKDIEERCPICGFGPGGKITE